MHNNTIIGELRYGNQYVLFEGNFDKNFFQIEVLNTLTFKNTIKKFTKLNDAKKFFETSIISVIPQIKNKELKEG